MRKNGEMIRNKKYPGCGNISMEIEKVPNHLNWIASCCNSIIDRFKDVTNEINQMEFELSNIKEILEFITPKIDFEEILQFLLEKAVNITKADKGFLYVFDRDRKGFRIMISMGIVESECLSEDNIKASPSVLKYLLNSSDCIIKKCIELKKGRLIFTSKGRNDCLNFKIFVKDEFWGFLSLMNKDDGREFDTEDIRILSIIINEIGFVIKNSVLQIKTRRNLKPSEGSISDLVQVNKRLQQEITERMRVENTLRETNIFLQNILDSSSAISIVSTDVFGNIVFWNRGAEELLGYRQDEVVGHKKIDILYPGEETKIDISEIKALIKKKHKVINRIVKEIRKDGKTLWMNLNLTPRFDDNGNVVGILGIGEDITKRRRLEEEFYMSQKMEALGTLAGGIVHDFNNLLTAIIGYAQLASFKIKKDNPLRSNIEDILIASQRAVELLKRVLTFCRPKTGERRQIEIQPILHESISLLRKTFPPSIIIEEEISQNLGYIVADPSEIHQIIMNLCQNSLHAMQETGGTLNICLDRVSIDEESPLLTMDMKPGEYLKLTVADTGSGIPNEIRDRIFDPYFTTNGISEGAGLGLAVVNNIVRTCKGNILVDSKLNEGSTFRVYLPVKK